MESLQLQLCGIFIKSLVVGSGESTDTSFMSSRKFKSSTKEKRNARVEIKVEAGRKRKRERGRRERHTCFIFYLIALKRNEHSAPLELKVTWQSQW